MHLKHDNWHAETVESFAVNCREFAPKFLAQQEDSEAIAMVANAVINEPDLPVTGRSGGDSQSKIASIDLFGNQEFKKNSKPEEKADTTSKDTKQVSDQRNEKSPSLQGKVEFTEFIHPESAGPAEPGAKPGGPNKPDDVASEGSSLPKPGKPPEHEKYPDCRTSKIQSQGSSQALDLTDWTNLKKINALVRSLGRMSRQKISLRLNEAIMGAGGGGYPPDPNRPFDNWPFDPDFDPEYGTGDKFARRHLVNPQAPNENVPLNPD